MEPITLQFDIKKIMQQNIIWTVILSVALVTINVIIQPPTWEFSMWLVIKSIIMFSTYYTMFIVLHEALHLVGFILFGRVSLKSLSYGLKPEQGIAYATTTEKLTNRAMKASLLLPFWITGVIPTVVGFYINSTTLILAGAFLMAGAVGDFMMYIALRKFPNNVLIEDDAEQPRLYVYTNHSQSNRK